jgi:hypothetical protein
MKKLAIFSVAIFCSLVVCQSQAQDTKNYASNLEKKERATEKPSAKKETRKLRSKNVSDYSLKSFYSDFGIKNNVLWRKTDYFDEAYFNQNNQSVTAYYDFDGKLIGTTTDKTFNDLPLIGQNTITKRYKDYSVESVLLYDFKQQSDDPISLDNAQFANSKNYFALLNNGKNRFVLQVDPEGDVYFFKQLY